MESQLETLASSSLRHELQGDANKRIEAVQFKQVFGEIKKDEELASVAKMILPAHLKSTLL